MAHVQNINTKVETYIPLVKQSLNLSSATREIIIYATLIPVIDIDSTNNRSQPNFMHSPTTDHADVYDVDTPSTGVASAGKLTSPLAPSSSSSLVSNPPSSQRDIRRARFGGEASPWC